MKTFIPTLAPEYGRNCATMLVELDHCPICNGVIIENISSRIFPQNLQNTFQKQVEAAGWSLASNVMVDGDRICAKCDEKDLATFACAICQDYKRSSELRLSIGWPPEYLCIECYKTVSAETWDKMVDKLEARHRYDFE